MGVSKLAWITNPDLLSQRFQRWLPDAAPYARVYLETIAMPAVPLFARLVPLSELATGLALAAGLWSHIVAAVSLVMVLNFHVATSAFSSTEFLRDGTGLPVLAGLLAIALAGRRLPFTLRP